MGNDIEQRPTLGMILKGFPRISETFISNEILRLEESGFRIHIFSMRKPRESFSHDSVKRIRAQVDYLPETMVPHLGRLLPALLRQAAQHPLRFLKAAALAAKRFSRTRKSATIKHLLQAAYLVDCLLPGTGVVHFHAHFAHSPTSVALFASMLGGIPFSFTAHAKDIYTSDPRQLGEKIAQADFVATCTAYNRRYLQTIAGHARTPLHLAYHGIDMALFNQQHALETKARAAQPARILTIARLTEKKGLPTILQALKVLKDTGVVFQYELIGDGDDRKDVLSLIDALGLASVTRWHGTLPHNAVIEHYKKADLFVLGCRIARSGDRDGIPNVLVESMAMGVPVIATRISAIPELVHDNQTGLLVPPRDPAALADAMTRLIRDTGLRSRIIPAARKRVQTDFDNRMLSRELATLYRQSIPALANIN